MSIKLEEIMNNEKYSRVNSYIFLGDPRTEKTSYFKSLQNITYLDFEKEGLNFFKSYQLTLKVFNRNRFFEYIKTISLNSENIVVIDNLEIIQNILFNSNELQDFFKDLILQKFKTKVIFVFSDIKIMKIQRTIKKYIPEKNFIMGDFNEN